MVIAAAGHVVEPRDQVDERRLAGAAAADNGHHLAGTDAERHPAQRRRVGARVRRSRRC